MNTLRTCENSAGRVPDASKITRFKQEFIDDLQLFLDSLVDLTEPILQEIDGDKASMTIFDTTGLEAYVTENNPKYANKKIRYYSNDLELYFFSKTIAWDYEQQRPYKGDTIREERRMYLHLYFNPDKLSDDGRIFDKKLDKLKEELLSGKRVPEHEKDYKKYKAIDLFKEIFREERKLKDACPDDRLKGRQEKVRPVFEELSAYIKSFGADDFDQSGLMYDALQYFSNQDKYLRGFLDGPLIPAHNSVCERDNAGFAVLSNNIKFIDSISGVVATADLYSLAATAKAHNIDFFSYMRYVLKELPVFLAKQSSRDYRNKQGLDAFLPWSPECRKKIDEEWDRRKEIVSSGCLFPGEDMHQAVTKRLRALQVGQ